MSDEEYFFFTSQIAMLSLFVNISLSWKHYKRTRHKCPSFWLDETPSIKGARFANNSVPFVKIIADAVKVFKNEKIKMLTLFQLCKLQCFFKLLRGPQKILNFLSMSRNYTCISSSNNKLIGMNVIDLIWEDHVTTAFI